MHVGVNKNMHIGKYMNCTAFTPWRVEIVRQAHYTGHGVLFYGTPAQAETDDEVSVVCPAIFSLIQIVFHG
jgi:hypothetical protein